MLLEGYRQGVAQLRGVGPAQQQRLARLGIRTVAQLLSHYPRAYQDRRALQPLAAADRQESINALVRVRSRQWIGRGYPRVLKAIVEDDSARAALLCFGRSYLSRVLEPGKRFWLWGRFSRRRGELEASSFELEAWEPEQESARFGRILPLYPLSEGLSQNVLRQAVAGALRAAGDLEDALPLSLRRRRGCLPKLEALRTLHFPSSLQAVEQARFSLVYEELLCYQMELGRSRLQRSAVRRSRRRHEGRLKSALLERLPFSLTGDQVRVLAEIEADLFDSHAHARLLQGEVGSGKTLVALICALLVVESGEQAALLAPTELLARQHADNAARLLEPLGVRVAFLSGAVKGRQRQMLLDRLAGGEVDLLVGTHALYSREVEYGKLGLVIIDEQHRFGVRQRQALLAKAGQSWRGRHAARTAGPAGVPDSTASAGGADLLLMTATPIPRTLALSAFGDLELSEIRTLPQGRKPVITHLARQGNEAKVYARVRQEVAGGGQAYFVYPLIEESQALGLKDAERMFRKLKSEVFSDLRLELIHSRIAEEEKIRIMREFASGKVQILVATSVMEVGVDVPGATCVVIEHAERFGLSNLHQLRGRVGRGAAQSYAFLIYSRSLTEAGIQRLKAIMESSDGFVIADTDLKIRGPGEFLGLKQSGFLRLGLADITRDWQLFLLAREDAREILEKDPGLLDPEHRAIGETLELQGAADEDYGRIL